MKGKIGSGGAQSCTIGEVADIYCAPENIGFSGAALLARAIANTPANERRLRGMV